MQNLGKVCQRRRSHGRRQRGAAPPLGFYTWYRCSR